MWRALQLVKYCIENNATARRNDRMSECMYTWSQVYDYPQETGAGRLKVGGEGKLYINRTFDVPRVPIDA